MLYLREFKTQQTYYFRRKIPVDLQKHFKTKEIRKSLKTSSKTEARKRSINLFDNSEQLFFFLRTSHLNENQKVKLIELYFENNLIFNLKYITVPSIPIDHMHEVQVVQIDKVCRATSIGKLIAQYINENSSSKNWSVKTTIEYENTFDSILSLISKNKPISTLTRNDLIYMRNTMIKLPVNLNKNKKYKGKSISELIAMTGVKRLTVQTVNKHMTRLSGFFNWAFENEHIHKNIATNLKIKTNNRSNAPEHTIRSVYTKANIETMCIHLPVETTHPERFWIPLIALYTGMRQNEICQLYKEDLSCIDGVWYFDINSKKDKLVKNKASVRLVPLHPTLINLGLIDYYNNLNDEPRLWMNLKPYKEKYNHQFGAWFQSFNRDHITNDSKKVFHSLRHTFTNQLKEQQVDYHIIAELLGHEHGSITFDRYAKRYKVKTLFDSLSKLDYGLRVQKMA